MQPDIRKGLVLGIGALALSDHGVGIKIVRYLERHYKPLAEIARLDTSALNWSLMPRLNNTEFLIVLNAAMLNKPPGTVSCLRANRMDQYLKQANRTTTEVALADLMEIAKLDDSLPPRRALISVATKNITWGKRLSAPVSRAIPYAAQQVLDLVYEWTGVNFGDKTNSVPN
jgi:hydrogenase maturation protease